jgi:hypothetical protein
MRRQQLTLTIYHEDGSETETQLPGRWCICGQCEGRGTSSAYLGAFTASEWAEQDDDFKDEYIRGGYDRSCDECNGSGKVWSIDYKKCTPEQRAALDEEAEYQALVAAERRMGA